MKLLDLIEFVWKRDTSLVSSNLSYKHRSLHECEAVDSNLNSNMVKGVGSLVSLPDNVMGYEAVYLSAFGGSPNLTNWECKKIQKVGTKTTFRMKNMIFLHKFWRSFWIACLSYFSRLQYVWFLVHMYGAIINSSGQLAELIVYMIPLEQICRIVWSYSSDHIWCSFWVKPWP